MAESWQQKQFQTNRLLCVIFGTHLDSIQTHGQRHNWWASFYKCHENECLNMLLCGWFWANRKSICFWCLSHRHRDSCLWAHLFITQTLTLLFKKISHCIALSLSIAISPLIVWFMADFKSIKSVICNNCWDWFRPKQWQWDNCPLVKHQWAYNVLN